MQHSRYVFRGYSVERDAWVFGVPLNMMVPFSDGRKPQLWNAIIPYEQPPDKVQSSTVVPVDPASVSQCTGLITNNARHIYEGDLLRDASRNWNTEKNPRIYEIAWHHCGMWGLVLDSRWVAENGRPIPARELIRNEDLTVVANSYEEPKDKQE